MTHRSPGTVADCNGGLHALASSLTVEILWDTDMSAIWSQLHIGLTYLVGLIFPAHIC